MERLCSAHAIQRIKKGKKMIILNGRQYAQNENEFIGSLFTAGNTADGYAKPHKNGVMFTDHNHERELFIANDDGVQFFVSVDGERFSYSTTSQADTKYGFDEMSHSDQRTLATEIYNQVREV